MDIIADSTLLLLLGQYTAGAAADSKIDSETADGT